MNHESEKRQSYLLNSYKKGSGSDFFSFFLCFFLLFLFLFLKCVGESAVVFLSFVGGVLCFLTTSFFVFYHFPVFSIVLL